MSRFRKVMIFGAGCLAVGAVFNNSPIGTLGVIILSYGLIAWAFLSSMRNGAQRKEPRP